MTEVAENRSKKYEGMPFTEVAAAFKKVCDDLKEASKVKTELEKEKKFLAESLVPEMMDESNPPITNITLEDIGRVTLTADVYARIPADNREKAYAWFRDHKLGDIIVETINSGTLKSTIKKIMKNAEHEQPPEDVFSITPFSRASITKVPTK